MDADTTDIVKFLNKFAPAEVVRLNALHPAARAHFRVRGVVLGKSEDDALKDAALAMLNSVASASSEASSQVFAKFASAHRWELRGSIVGLFSSGGVLTAILGFNSKWSAVVLGAVGFLANAIPLIAGWLKSSPTGVNVGQAMSQLRQYAWEAQQLRASIIRGGWEAERERILTDSNEIARKAYIVLSDLGFTADLRPV